MSASINQVLLVGNLTRDPEMRTFGERHVVNFAMAMNRHWKQPSGEQKEEVTFVECEAWGRTAELVGQYLHKGSNCLIQGRLRLDAWEDKETKQKRSRLKVIAEHVQFLGSRDQPSSAGPDPESDHESDHEAPVAATTAPAPGPATRTPFAARSAARRVSEPANQMSEDPPF